VQLGEAKPDGLVVATIHKVEVDRSMINCKALQP
jgi:hypothetical protein